MMMHNSQANILPWPINGMNEMENWKWEEFIKQMLLQPVDIRRIGWPGDQALMVNERNELNSKELEMSRCCWVDKLLGEVRGGHQAVAASRRSKNWMTRRGHFTLAWRAGTRSVCMKITKNRDFACSIAFTAFTLLHNGTYRTLSIALTHPTATKTILTDVTFLLESVVTNGSVSQSFTLTWSLPFHFMRYMSSPLESVAPTIRSASKFWGSGLWPRRSSTPFCYNNK